MVISVSRAGLGDIPLGRIRQASEDGGGVEWPGDATDTGWVSARISLEQSQLQSAKSSPKSSYEGLSPSFLLPLLLFPVMKNVALLSLITSCETWYDSGR